MKKGPFSAQQFRQANIYRLDQPLIPNGSGVFRLVDKVDGRSRVVKIFAKAEQLSNDVKAFEKIAEFGSDFDQVNLVSFRILEPTRLELEDVRGRILPEVLRSPSLSEERKMELTEAYMNYLDHIENRALNQESLVFGRRSENRLVLVLMFRSPEASDGTMTILLKPDNFVVDGATHQLRVIDPY